MEDLFSTLKENISHSIKALINYELRQKIVLKTWWLSSLAADCDSGEQFTADRWRQCGRVVATLGTRRNIKQTSTEIGTKGLPHFHLASNNKTKVKIDLDII